MMYFIAIAFFLGYVSIMLYGLLRLARELITKPHPPPLLDADSETDQDDQTRGERPSPSAAQQAGRAIDMLRHWRESP